MEKIVQHLKQSFKYIAAGRADPDLLHTIKASCYDNLMPVDQLGSASIVDYQTLQFQLYDAGIINEVAKAISLSPLNLQVNKAKSSLIIKFPPISGDTRKKLVAVAKETAEHQRIALRSVRHNLKRQLKKEDISADHKKGLERKLDALVKRFSEQINSITDAKKNELLTK